MIYLVLIVSTLEVDAETLMHTLVLSLMLSLCLTMEPHLASI